MDLIKIASLGTTSISKLDASLSRYLSTVHASEEGLAADRGKILFSRTTPFF